MKENHKYEILTPEGFVDFDGIEKSHKKTIEIFFHNGLALRGSFNHKIYDYDGDEIILKNIKIGDKIKSKDGFFNVINIKKYKHKTNVYDIVNSGELHLYFTNDIISHNCNFLGSGDGIVSADIIDNIMKNMIKDPVEKYMMGQFWAWKDPIPGHRYIMGVDVSRGDSEDYSSINIIDFDDMEQVVEYIGKMPPDDLAGIAYKWGILYKAFIVIDITGGMGVATARKLQEMGYRDLFIDGINTQNVWEYDAKLLEKIPGINFNNKRTQIVASLEEHLRHGFLVRSVRFMNELNTFVYINGRPDHMKGKHDDSIMSMSIALYGGDLCFGQLQKADAINKSMMESWTISERTYEPNKSFYSYGKAFDPFGVTDANTGREIMNPLFENPNVKQRQNQYRDYAWLFGNIDKHR